MNKNIKKFENTLDINITIKQFLSKVVAIKGSENIFYNKFSEKEFEEIVRLMFEENIIEYAMGYWRTKAEKLEMTEKDIRTSCIKSFASFNSAIDTKNNYIVSGEFCEFLAFLHMKYVLGIPPLVNKVYESDAGQQVKGFDGVHIDDKLHLSIIESKIYSSLQPSIKEAHESIDQIWKSDIKIQQEKRIINSQVTLKKNICNPQTVAEFDLITKKHSIKTFTKLFDKSIVNTSVYIILQTTNLSHEKILLTIKKNWKSQLFNFEDVNFYIFATDNVNVLRRGFYNLVNKGDYE